MADLRLEGVSKEFSSANGQRVAALREVELVFPAGSWTALLGPSGAGKTTLLRVVAGLEMPDRGRVTLGGRDLAGTAPGAREVGMVFQDHPLFPHLNVAGNLGFALRLQRLPAAERDQRVTEMAGWMGLGSLLNRLPASLSGGERQRTALGSVLLRRPRVVLLDEPLAQVDPVQRQSIRQTLREWRRQFGSTVLHVTHDLPEAMALADQVVVLRGGVVQQTGTPTALQERPVNAFVEGFLRAGGEVA